MRTVTSLLIVLALVLPACVLAQDVADLASKAASNDAAERLAAFDALRGMGAAGVEGLLKLLVPAEQGGDSGARIALHGLAVRLSAPGEPAAPRAAFAKALGDYLKTEAATECKQFVVIQLHICGSAECVPGLVAMLSDADLAGDAVQALAVNPSPEAVTALRAALATTDGATRVQVIQALGQRKDTKAVPQLMALAQTAPDEVMIACVSALGEIGDPAALKLLLPALDRGPEDDRAPVYEALLRLAEGLVTSNKASEARAVYVRVLAATKTPAVRQAAIIGLGKSGTPEDAGTFIVSLTDADAQVRRSAEDALVSLPGEQAGVAIAEATRAAKPETKVALLTVLSRRDEPAGKRAIEATTRDEDVNVRVRALELLDRLTDPAVRDTILEGAKAGNGVAVAAYVRQADAVRDGGKPDEARPMYLTALECAKTDELKSLALYGLAGVPQADLLPLVEPLLNADGTREAALRLYTAIASRLAAEGDQERGKQMLLRALELGPSRGLTGEIVGKLRGLGVDVDPAHAAGFISKWWVIGPFPGENIDADLPPEKAIDLAAPIKVGDRELTWTQHQTIDPMGIVNYAALMQPNTNVTAYMYAEVTVEQAQDVLLKCGSDDGMKLWLNGQQVHRAPQPRSLRVDEDSVEAHLEAGANKVLVKVVQGGGGWEACIRLTDRNGTALRFSQ
ncbi:MAG: HEAT repeat domain-containing protein [Armatimonadetes bacterium]|nr:HEAT repeat domain-containing protein [Armatimonadota bacterium]